MIATLALVAHCVVASSPVLDAIAVSGVRASRLPDAVRLGDHTATPCDTLPAPHPSAIASWHDRLAVGFRDGGVWLWDGDSFAELAGLPATPIRALAAVGDTLWIGTGTEGLWAIGDPAAKARRFEHPTLGHAPITALAAAGDRLRIGVDPRGEWQIDGDVAKLVRSRALVGCMIGGQPRPPGSCGRGTAEVPIHVTALVAYRDHLYVGTFDDGVWEQRDRTFQRVPSPRLVNAMLAVDGALYLGSATGLYRMTGSTSFEPVELGLPSSHINDLAASGDTLWLATSRGVAGWDGRTVRMLDTGAARTVYAITVASDGAIWAGTIGGAIRFGTDGTTRFDRARGTLPGDWVTALIPDDRGAVLAGTYDAGVMRLAADGSSSPVAGFDGELWINPHGLARIDGKLAAATLGQALHLATGTSPRLPDTDVTAIVTVRGTTWIGTRGGLARIDP